MFFSLCTKTQSMIKLCSKCNGGGFLSSCCGLQSNVLIIYSNISNGKTSSNNSDSIHIFVGLVNIKLKNKVHSNLFIF